MTALGIMALLVFVGVLSLCFKQNREAKHIFNVIGWGLFIMIALAAMAFASIIGLG